MLLTGAASDAVEERGHGRINRWSCWITALGVTPSRSGGGSNVTSTTATSSTCAPHGWGGRPPSAWTARRIRLLIWRS